MLRGKFLLPKCFAKELVVSDTLWNGKMIADGDDLPIAGIKHGRPRAEHCEAIESLSEEEDAIEEMYEPYLMQLGLLDRTQRGRVATALAYKHFGMDEPRRQPGLFS
jgi:hypothetical protein